MPTTAAGSLHVLTGQRSDSGGVQGVWGPLVSGRGGWRMPVVDATTKAILVVHYLTLHTYIIHSIILTFITYIHYTLHYTYMHYIYTLYTPLYLHALHTYIIHSIILKYLKDKLRMHALQKFSSPFCEHHAAPCIHWLVYCC